MLDPGADLRDRPGALELPLGLGNPFLGLPLGLLQLPPAPSFMVLIPSTELVYNRMGPKGPICPNGNEG